MLLADFADLPNTIITFCQICSNGILYGLIKNKQIPLTDLQIKTQPHVLATCFSNDCVPAEIAPFHKQIGECDL